jgi:carbon-monoxide dehydrogenase large subunit
MAVEEKEIGGIGHSVKRKEDDRFIRGKGNYVDDIQLPNMLHMAILRSPLAHAVIKSIDTSKAQELPGVVAVVTAELLAQHNLAWMPTIAGDTQAVLAMDKVRLQGQEVAAVIAEDAYTAHDALELIEVDYDPLPAVVDPRKALEEGAPIIRDDKEGKTDNRVYDWEAGDKEATDNAFEQAEVVVKLDTHYPRSHPAPIETCGCVSDVNPATGKATIYMTSQAPHAHRTVFALVAGLPEQNIQIISPDLGGGFGNKVPVYPGYVVATAASLLLGRPVKWIEDRTENLISTGFARDFHMHGELALKRDGKMLGLKVNMLSDQGAFYADAMPSKLRAGLFHIVTGSYDMPAAHVVTHGAYTNKAPGGVAYRCSFRVTEASYLIERLVQNAAYELEMDPAEIRRKNFIRADQFPYTSATGFVYDSGDYHKAMDVALEAIGYDELEREKEEARNEGKLLGVGLASFTEVLGAGPSKDYDILGLKMFDSAELRVHPTGKAILKLGVKTQGQGHETTFAQIVASELGIPYEDVIVQHGDTDNTPYGLGTYASRSTPVGGAATAMVARKLRDKARKIAAHLLETSEADIEWETGRFFVKGVPTKGVTIQEIAFAAYTNHPQGMEAGLEGVHYYDPPNLTFPFGTYVAVVEVDPETGAWKVRRFVAVDDCGIRINPMIVAGQIHGGLAEGFAMASMQQITFDEDGNCLGSNFTDYLLPTSYDTPGFELHATVTPSPHHPLGAKGVGESATVGSPAAYINAVIDALAHLGVRNVDMPATSAKVWEAIQEAQTGRQQDPDRSGKEEAEAVHKEDDDPTRKMRHD